MKTNYPNALSIPMKENILQSIDTHIKDMQQTHNKVFVMRLDIHAKDNAEFSQFNQRLMLSEKRSGIDSAYVAVGEKSSNGENHYHELLLLDGNKTQSFVKHIQKATRIMNNLRGLPTDNNNGLIDDCNASSNPQPNGIMLRRNDQDKTNLHNVYRQASYLAKEAQKEDLEKGTRNVFASQQKSARKNSSK